MAHEDHSFQAQCLHHRFDILSQRIDGPGFTGFPGLSMAGQIKSYDLVIGCEHIRLIFPVLAISAPAMQKNQRRLCLAADFADDVRAADGLNIVCEIRGKAEPALVFLHGWCGDREYWKNQADVFAADYQVVTLDLPGHGESGKARETWTVNALGQDVESMVKALGLKRVILVGHSMGGPIALAAAKRMPGKVVGVIG